MNKNKIIDIFFWLALLAAVAFGVYRFFIARNFLVTFQIDCDPTVDSCFVGYCDPSFDECTGNEEDDIWYYAKVKKMAYDVQKCDPSQGECPDKSICDQPLLQRCWIEKCDPNNIGEDEECIDPETYLAKHPDALEEDESDDSSGAGEDEVSPEEDALTTTNEDSPEASEGVESGEGADAVPVSSENQENSDANKVQLSSPMPIVTPAPTPIATPTISATPVPTIAPF